MTRVMLLTTSRKPGQLTRAVCRTLADALGAAYLNRGKAGVENVLAEADSAGANKVWFLWERNGNPSRLVCFDLKKAMKMQAKEKENEVYAQKWEGKNEEKNVKEKSAKKKPENSAETNKNKESGEVNENNKREETNGLDKSQEEKNDKEKDNNSEPESAWLKPEISIYGMVYNRKPMRQKGASIHAEDSFGKTVAKLLDAKEGPNQIVLSRFGLKVFVDSDLVLELKFRV